MMESLGITIGLLITGGIAFVVSLIRKNIYKDQELARARMVEAERRIDDEVKTKSDDDLDAAIHAELEGTAGRDGKG